MAGLEILLINRKKRRIIIKSILKIVFTEGFYEDL